MVLRVEVGGLNLYCLSGCCSSTRLVMMIIILIKMTKGILKKVTIIIIGASRRCSIGAEVDDTRRREGQINIIIVHGLIDEMVVIELIDDAIWGVIKI